ncbi:DegT/DnrJ/EryC1/StrS family aminotransferase [Prochlorococcus sp. AH-736-F09]|nr:DegT/DnrJ/EryC1/StrS family aminotransferase [Prochlorococcus sp. AH-736-F09]
MKNFYPNQYKNDKKHLINHNYLTEQFSDVDEILKKIKEVVIRNDFTLGEVVDEVESLIAKEAGTKYAIGVGSGTDAIFLSLKALGIKEGDEVITTTYTFYATIGAIVTAGAKPVLCDCDENFNIDPNRIEEKITAKTKAIIPVHWAGRPCEMHRINSIAKKYSLFVIEDACHALQAELDNKRCGSLGDIGCFSFHPLKNLNVWGDGGIVTTNNKSISDKLKLIRNHGLVDRNTCMEFSYNSRLDTIQAVVAKHLIENNLETITKKRIENAHYFDSLLSKIPQIKTLERKKFYKEVFHLYVFTVERREELALFLQKKEIDAKIHYPIPMHLQPAAKKYNFNNKDFPIAQKLAQQTISLPVHEFITTEQIEFVVNTIKDFFN